MKTKAGLGPDLSGLSALGPSGTLMAGMGPDDCSSLGPDLISGMGPDDGSSSSSLRDREGRFLGGGEGERGGGETGRETWP